MALTGLDIYKLLPKTNCKECGFATCLAFAMALAQKKVSLDKCPHVTAESREALESASQPPIRLVTIGTGERKLEIGNETVMYRHEQKFHHPAGIGFLVEDTQNEDEIDAAVKAINSIKFDRAGQELRADLICVKNSSNYRNRFINALRKVDVFTPLNIALYSDDIPTAEDALKIVGSRRPLLICGEAKNLKGFMDLARDKSLPLAITCADPEEAALLTDRAKKAGVDEIIINLKSGNIADRIQGFTFMRRGALKKSFRPFGYPVMAFTESEEPEMELAEAVSYIAKYAGLIILRNTDRDLVFPILVARQDIYQDPQKPVQVEPGIYRIGRVRENSPVLVTTNFSITYFTVAGEVESSKVASYIVCCDSEGMSVLTAWAAEKFTPEKIADAILKSGIGNMVSHKNLIIPGYVSVMSGKLEEATGWKVSVGPREASGIPNYLRNWKG